MKLVTIFIMAFFIQVSAATKAQQVTLNENKASLKKILNEISDQTGYAVLGQSDLLDAAQVVTINVRQAPLQNALIAVFKNQNISYVIKDKAIVIKQKESTEVTPSPLSLPAPDSILYVGYVLDETGHPLIGATIHLKGSSYASISIEPKGYFERRGNPKSVLVVTYIGYATVEYSLSKQDPNQPIIIKMQKGTTDLEEVTIVNDGYQSLPKERATGSYEVITAKDLQHSTDPNLLKRLQGITTSFNFNNQLTPNNSALKIPQASGLDNLTIRGRNTLNSSSTTYPLIRYGTSNSSGVPLVVIDGVASPYSIDQVNPNDVDNITILKDAAASSIWGSRAANGVIVITTKKGKFNHKTQISFGSNLTVTAKPNLFYNKEMSTSEFVDAEIYAFQQAGITTAAPNLTTQQPAMSPIQEILNAQQLGNISQGQATSMLDSLRGNDVRRDLTKYFYRNAVTQDYSLAVSGGSDKTSSNLSLNYDKSLNNTVDNENDRTNITYSINTKPLKNLQLGGAATYSLANTNMQSFNSQFAGESPLMDPYTRLADANGNPLPVIRDYRPSFISLLESTYGSNIENLDYSPLSDIYQGYRKYKSEIIFLNLTANYRLSSVFSANLVYGYTRTGITQTNYDSKDSYYMRNLYTEFTNPTTLNHAVPAGGLLQTQNTPNTNQTLRGQVNVDKIWDTKNEFHAIIGSEITNQIVNYNATGYYGYDPVSLRTDAILDFKNSQTRLFGTAYTGVTSQPIPGISNGLIEKDQVRTYSLFTSGTYTYDNRYSLSFSGRQDANSEFGTSTNHTVSPFYSFGAGWNVNKEAFYHSSWLTYLRFRATFGYNGNVNPVVAPVTVVSYQYPSNYNNFLPTLTYNASTGVSNNQLRPEKTGILNLGLDWGIKNGRVSGSFEYYDKRTSGDLIGAGLDPTTGFDNTTYNIADLHGRGVEVDINSVNIKTSKFSWSTNLNLAHNREIVTKLYNGPVYPQNAGLVVEQGYGANYVIGEDLNRIFAYRWAGLDPKTGDPMGYVDGKATSITGDYNGYLTLAAIQAQPQSTAHYMGSSVPVLFGAINNTFSYGRISLYAMVRYSFGFVFRKPYYQTVNYTNLYAFAGGRPQLQPASYNQRWQKPGDELHTNVPSAALYAPWRDQFYQDADINILPGDNIRLQELNLGYTFKSQKWIKSPTLGLHVSNIGLLWVKNKEGLDPEVYDIPAPRTYSLAFNCSF